MDYQDSVFQHAQDGQDSSAHLMTSSEYVSRAIAICVHPTMVGSSVHLDCAGDRDQVALSRLHAELREFVPHNVADSLAWATEKVSKIFETSFKDDVWHSSLPSGLPVVLLKQASLDERKMGIEEALKRIHLSQVTLALQDGLDVPSSVINEYKMTINAMSDRG